MRGKGVEVPGPKTQKLGWGVEKALRWDAAVLNTTEKSEEMIEEKPFDGSQIPRVQGPKGLMQA